MGACVLEVTGPTKVGNGVVDSAVHVGERGADAIAEERLEWTITLGTGEVILIESEETVRVTMTKGEHGHGHGEEGCLMIIYNKIAA